MLKAVFIIGGIVLTYFIVKRGLKYVVERQESLTRSEIRHIQKAKQEWDSTPDQALHTTEDMTASLEEMWAAQGIS